MKRSILTGLLFVLVVSSVFSIGTKEQNIKKTAQHTDSTPQRIVSLVPAATETLFAVGAGPEVIARTDFCTWPAEAATVPSVGGFDGKAVSLEKIIAFQPDLVCLSAEMHGHLVQPLRQHGIRTFVSSSENIGSVLEEIAALAELTGHAHEGAECIRQINSQLEQARAMSHRGTPPRVYWEVSSAPYFTCGANSFISDLLNEIGAENIFADVAQAYPQVVEESIIVRAPDIIIFPDYDGTGSIQRFLERRGWRQVPAIREEKIFPVDSDMFSRPGPRVGQMAIELSRILYSVDSIEQKTEASAQNPAS